MFTALTDFNVTFVFFQDSWMYHLTVVSGGGPNAGTQYEQLVQKLMETDGDPSELVLLF